MGRLTRAARYVRRPSWGIAYWRSRRASLPAEAPERVWFADEHGLLAGLPDALAAVTGQNRGRCKGELDSAWLPDHVDELSPQWWPRDRLMRVAGALVALLAARVVVEVGVARGYTSAALLAALAPAGRLHSIDLPPLDEDERSFVGTAVPASFRERWSLQLGPSAALLAQLLERTGEIDLFLHDGDHSYRSQREDLETAWPHVRPGGVALVDDIWTPAVRDFAAEHDARLVIGQWGDPADGLGLLAKPARA
jgi:hypothetical protein